MLSTGMLRGCHSDDNRHHTQVLRLRACFYAQAQASAEVEVYNRDAPGGVFAGANATHRAFTPFDGYPDSAAFCCRLEPVLSVGVGVFTRQHLSLWIIENDSRPPIREIELSRRDLNGEHFMKIAEMDTFGHLFYILKPSPAIRLAVIPIGRASFGYPDVGSWRQSEKNIEVQNE